ncbi:MAG: hypothetical protein WCC12_19660 [Anaerolineales bacterium]
MNFKNLKLGIKLPRPAVGSRGGRRPTPSGEEMKERTVMYTWSIEWIGLGLLIWILGYRRVKDANKIGLSEMGFVHPPFLIYLVCGLPKAPYLPRGVMPIPPLLGQLAGLLWIVLGLIFSFIQNIFLLVLLIGTVMILTYVWILSKRNLYKIE